MKIKLTDINQKVTIEQADGHIIDLTNIESEFEYGIRWSKDSVPERIGSDKLHRTLPIQSLMRRCIYKTETGGKIGSTFKYIDDSDYSIYEDGTLVDYGADGDLFVRIPKYWYKAFDKTENGTTYHYLYLYTKPVPGCKESKEVYVGAVEASADTERTALYSKVKTKFSWNQSSDNGLFTVSAGDLSYDSDAADYRGGTNNSDYDSNINACLLGRPVSNMTRDKFRLCAAIRGTGFSLSYFTAYCAWLRLYVVEFCNFNSLNAVAYEENGVLRPGPDGYMHGGLGPGTTNFDWGAWSNMNGINPFIPCGVTLKLCNNSGRVIYSNQSLSVEVPSYRGIENPFGHIWEWIDGINFYNYEALVCDDIKLFQDDTKDGYVTRGLVLNKAGAYISDFAWDENGEFLVPPSGDGGSANGLIGDCWWVLAGWRVCGSGGCAYNVADAGLFCFNGRNTSSDVFAAMGGRLYFTPQA